MHPYEIDLIRFFVLVFVIGFLLIAVVDILTPWPFHRKPKTTKTDEGLAILSKRLEDQRKTQLRMIKERDAYDSDLFDKVEEARRDFDNNDRPD